MKKFDVTLLWQRTNFLRRMILSSSSRVRVGSRSVLHKQVNWPLSYFSTPSFKNNINIASHHCLLLWIMFQNKGAALLNWPVISVLRFYQSWSFFSFCLLGQLVHWETLVNAISALMPWCVHHRPTCDRVLSSRLPCFLTGKALVGGLHPSPRLLGRPTPPSPSLSFPHLFRSLFSPTYSRITFAFTFSAYPCICRFYSIQKVELTLKGEVPFLLSSWRSSIMTRL